MKKRIRMKMPSDSMTLNEIEKWLMDMAEKGLVLVKLKNTGAVFEEDKPQYIKYKIIPYMGDMFAKVREKYSEQGYERAATECNMASSDIQINTIPYYVFKCTDPENTTEITGDAFTKEYLKDVYKKQRRSIFYSMGSFSIAAVSGYLQYRLSSSFEPHSIMLYMVVIVMALLPNLAHIYRLLFRLPAVKEEIMHEQAKEAVFRQNSFFIKLLPVIYICFFLGYAALTIFGNAPDDWGRNVQDLSEIDEYVSIVDVEGEEVLDVTWGDYERSVMGVAVPTFFIPVHYGQVNDFKTLPDIDYDADIYYEILYYKLRLKCVPDMAYDKWVKRAGWYLFFDEVLHCESTDYFDKIAFYYYDYSSNDNKMLNICFVNDKEFIHMEYNGDKTPLEIAEILEEKLSEVS